MVRKSFDFIAIKSTFLQSVLPKQISTGVLRLAPWPYRFWQEGMGQSSTGRKLGAKAASCALLAAGRLLESPREPEAAGANGARQKEGKNIHTESCPARGRASRGTKEEGNREGRSRGICNAFQR